MNSLHIRKEVMAFLFYNMQRYCGYIVLLLSIFLIGCGSEKSNENHGNPAWVAEMFYRAFADQDYERASYYCDNRSKETLSSYSYIVPFDEVRSFVSVDSCELYEEHAYCYCKYNDVDSVAQVEKILLRNYADIWKVHFTKGGFGKKDNSILYSTEAKPQLYSPDQLTPLSAHETTEVDSVLNTIFSLLDNVDVVLSFFEESRMKTLDVWASKENTFENYYVRRDFLNSLKAVYKYHFDEEVLSSYEVTVSNIISENTFSVYAYILEKMNDKYGEPYNTNGINESDWYRYQEIKWFLNSYNHELLVAADSDNVTITLLEAY